MLFDFRATPWTTSPTPIVCKVIQLANFLAVAAGPDVHSGKVVLHESACLEKFDIEKKSNRQQRCEVENILEAEDWNSNNALE